MIICSVKHLNFYIVAPTCDDGVKNANETDIDCGGTCLVIRRCSEGQGCNSKSDCLIGDCRSNICQGECNY